MNPVACRTSLVVGRTVFVIMFCTYTSGAYSVSICHPPFVYLSGRFEEVAIVGCVVMRFIFCGTPHTHLIFLMLSLLVLVYSELMSVYACVGRPNSVVCPSEELSCVESSLFPDVQCVGRRNRSAC